MAATAFAVIARTAFGRPIGGVARDQAWPPSTMPWVARGDTEYLSIKLDSGDPGTTGAHTGVQGHT